MTLTDSIQILLELIKVTEVTSTNMVLCFTALPQQMYFLIVGG